VAEHRTGLEGHSANHRHFFRALRSRGSNTIRTMTVMTSISPMIYGTSTRAVLRVAAQTGERATGHTGFTTRCRGRRDTDDDRAHGDDIRQ